MKSPLNKTLWTKIISLTMLTIVSLSPHLHAQESLIKFERINNEQGLLSNGVPSIVQDDKGFMWFGTLDGLNRYDGYNFKVYRQDPEVPGSLSDNPIRVVYPEEDRECVMANVSVLSVDSPTQTHDNQVMTPDGEIRWHQWTNRVVFNSQGDVVAYQSVGQDITERKKAEEKLRVQSHDIGERVKELNCLYGISKLVETPDIATEEIIQGTIDLIPPSWRYPEITCARAIIDWQKFETVPFRETSWKQSSEIKIFNKQSGILEVFLMEEKPEIDEGPFLKEERSLIDAVAHVGYYEIDIVKQTASWSVL